MGRVWGVQRAASVGLRTDRRKDSAHTVVFFKDTRMNAIKLVAIFLIVGGALGLLYGGFSYTKETSRADIGPIHFQVNERERVNIPLWVGIGAIVGGVALLLTARKP